MKLNESAGLFRLAKDERGQATIFMALCMSTVLLGFFALAMDAGMLYRQKRLVQTAADAGALAAAAGESSGASISTSAQTAATQNGLTVGAGRGQATVAASLLAQNGNTGYVQVAVTEHTPTLFLGAFSARFNPLDISAVAQASYTITNSACFTALSQTGAAVAGVSGAETNGSTSMTWGTTVMSDIAVTGNGQLLSPSCGVQACGPASEANGNGDTAAALFAAGSGLINASSNAAPSWGTDNSGSTVKAVTSTQACSGDPMASQMPSAPTPGTCIDPSWMSQGTAGGNAETISSGTYCNFNTANVSTLTMNPGLYVVTKTFSTNSASKIVGNGVTFYLANGAIANASNYTYVSGGATPYGVGNGTTMNISAPTTGTYAGIALWDGNSSNSTPDTVTWGGGSSSTFSGAIYAPNSNLVFNNGSGTSTISSSVVANTISVTGGAKIQNNFTSTGAAASGGVNLVE
ncbi:MAG TPA: pilus assembly protein TadG-related protein [Terracidiphilus sp.]|jgi:Flp pilus assembly protein TadG|nr:pilus assembly protein TadG-related protein [Terracidiphilus sp.]